MDHHGGKREQEQEYADKTYKVEDLLPLPDLIVRVYLLITRRYAECCIEEVYDITAACMGEVVERMDLVILVDNADAFLAVYRAGINLMVFNGADILLVKLVYECCGIGILQICCGVAVFILEEPLVILRGNYTEININRDCSLNALKLVIGIRGIVALVKSGRNAVDAAGRPLLEVFLHSHVGYHRAHGVAGDADFILVDKCPRCAGIVDEVLHVHIVVLRFDRNARITVAVCIAGNDDKSTAGKLDHVLILMVKIVVASMRQDDKRELVVLAGFFRDIDLAVYHITLIHDYFYILHLDGIEARHKQRRKNAAYQAKAQRHSQNNFCAFLHFFLPLSFYYYSRYRSELSIAFYS